MFTKEESAAEIGTSRASMNRCGKTNAAKGVHNHYNEYKDFHSREVEAHVCASFMHMCRMENIEGKFLNEIKRHFQLIASNNALLCQTCTGNVIMFSIVSSSY